jgi:type I restriction enzyme S subunit
MIKWTEMTLGDLFTVDNLKLGPHSEEPTVMSLSKYDGFVRASDYFDKRIASSKLDGYKVVEPGAWAFSTIHIDEGSIARNNLAEPGVISPMYTTMHFVSEVCLPEYAELLLKQPRMLAEYRARAQGTVNRRRSLPFSRFSGIPVALPSLDEQRRIVDLISAVVGQIEAVVDEVRLLDAMWGSLGARMVDALVGEATLRLDEVADISGGITKNKKDLDQPDLVEVPYLRVANVHRRYLDLTTVATIMTTPSKASALRLLPGDVLFNEGGDKDKLGRGDVWQGQIPNCIHQNHVFRARVTDPGFDPRFVSAWGNTFGKGWFETFGTQTTGIASINKQTLSRFPLPDVSRAVQESWADRLDGVVRSHQSVSGELASLRTFRSALLSSLLNQDIEIPESYDSLLEAAS